MSDGILFRIHAGVVQVVEDAIQHWQPAGDDPDLAEEVERVVRECLDYPARMRAAWEDDWRFLVLAAEQERALDCAGKAAALARFLDGSVRVLTALQRQADQVAASGSPIASSAALAAALAEARTVRRKALGTWALVDTALCREARAAWQRGEYPSVSLALDALLAARECARIPGLEPEAMCQAAAELDAGQGHRLEDVLKELGD